MELRQLRYLDAVLETGTFTAAAERCHVAQPALWAQVRALEVEWDLALFERLGRRVRPTAAALALRPLVRVLLGDAGNIASEVLRLASGESGAVRLGTSPYQLSFFLAEAVARYTDRFPSAPPPVLVPIPTRDPYALLREGEVDLVSGTEPEAHGFSAAPLYDVWLVAVGRNVRPGTMEVSALRDHRLVLFRRSYASRSVVETALAKAGVEPSVFFEGEHADGLIALAREGVATAVVVNEALPPELDLPSARLALKGKSIEFRLSLMWRDEATLSAAGRRLRDVIVELAADRRRLAAASAPRGRAGPTPRRARRRRDR